MAFLPMNIKEVKARGWDEVDFVYVMATVMLTTRLSVLP